MTCLSKLATCVQGEQDGCLERGGGKNFETPFIGFHTCWTPCIVIIPLLIFYLINRSEGIKNMDTKN